MTLDCLLLSKGVWDSCPVHGLCTWLPCPRHLNVEQGGECTCACEVVAYQAHIMYDPLMRSYVKGAAREVDLVMYEYCPARAVVMAVTCYKHSV